MTHLGVPPYDGKFDYWRANIALSRISGMSFEYKFGANTAVGSVTREDLWSVGGLYDWLTAAETIQVAAGGDAADTSDGDNARVITVEGLDGNFAEISEDIILAGASASAATTNTYVRVFRAFVKDSGTYTTGSSSGSNAGAINIENTTSTNTLCQIQAGYGQSQMTHYTLPAGRQGILLATSVTVDANQVANVRVCQRQNANDVSVPVNSPRILYEVDAFVGQADRSFEAPIILPAKTDIWADALAAASSASINLNYDLLIVHE